MSLTRRITSFLLAVLFCLTAAACAKTEQKPADETTVPTEDTTTAETPVEPESDYLLPNPDMEVKEPANPLKIYVTAGADATAADGTEAHPYATLEDARDAARAADKTGHDSVDVIVSGKFYRTDAFVLTAEDSGTADCRIRYIGTEGAAITGGVTIPASDFAPVTDAEYLGYFNDEVETDIVTVDLKKYGVTPEEVAYGEYVPYTCDGMNSLFCGDSRLTLARYPDGKYLSFGNIETVENEDGKFYNIKYTEIHNTHIEKWHDVKNVYVEGYFAVYWGQNQTRMASFDTENTIMTMVVDSGYTAQKGQVYYWYNIPEELDTAGEYYITEDAVLYYLPGEENKDKDVYYPVLQNNLLYSDASYITVKGITFEDCQLNAVRFAGDYIDFIGNTVHRTGYAAGSFNGMNNRIFDCEVAYTAVGGFTVIGGDRDNMIMSNCVAANNYVHNYSERKATYCGAFNISGCGITLRNNEIAHANHLGISYSGACNLIEYNEAYDLLNYTDDAGVTYCGRTLACYGNVIRYNYFHDLGTPSLEKFSVCGIYFDDGIGGQIAYGNVIENVYGYAYFSGGGADCEIYDNLAINARTAVYCDQRYYDRLVAGVLDSNHMDSVKSQLENDVPYVNTFSNIKKMNNNGDAEDEWNWTVPARNKITGNRAFFAETDLGAEVSPVMYGHYCFTDAVLKFSTVEDNTETIYNNGEQPSVTDAIAQSGLDIPFEQIGRNK